MVLVAGWFVSIVVLLLLTGGALPAEAVSTPRRTAGTRKN